MNPFSYARPSGIDEAIGLFRPNSRYIAGGTNLLDLMKLQIETPGHLIDVNRIGLDKIEPTEGRAARRSYWPSPRA